MEQVESVALTSSLYTLIQHIHTREGGVERGGERCGIRKCGVSTEGVLGRRARNEGAKKGGWCGCCVG